MADTHTYHLKWKGQRSGPFSVAEIEAKLQRREVSSMHEIEHQGRWITLRAFMAQREVQRPAAAPPPPPTMLARPSGLPAPSEHAAPRSAPPPMPGGAYDFSFPASSATQPANPEHSTAVAACFYIRAGFTMRVVAALLDAGVFLAGILVMDKLRWISWGSPLSLHDILTMPTVAFVAGWLVLALTGAAMLEGSPLQGTLGKWAVGLVVTDRNGMPLNTAHAFKRVLLKLVGALPFGFGWFMAAFNQEGRAMHDLVADTHVVLRVTAARLFR